MNTIHEFLAVTCTESEKIWKNVSNWGVTSLPVLVSYQHDRGGCMAYRIGHRRAALEQFPDMIQLSLLADFSVQKKWIYTGARLVAEVSF